MNYNYVGEEIKPKPKKKPKKLRQDQIFADVKKKKKDCGCGEKKMRVAKTKAIYVNKRSSIKKKR